MKNTRRTLKERYTIFIASIIAIIIATQAVVQYDLQRQNEDAGLINRAGRQRMLSQRIVKLAIYIRDDINTTHGSSELPRFIDSLTKFTKQWVDVHHELLTRSALGKNNELIDSLLKKNTKPLTVIAQASGAIQQHRDSVTVNENVATIAAFESEFVVTMDRIVNEYQHEAEEKLSTIKKVELVLAVVALLLLLLEFNFFFRPAINKLRTNNVKLSRLNRRLRESNSQLASSQEEIRAQLDQITELRETLDKRETQLRELVETASDLMYELDENGKFTYVNPVLETLTEYHEAELYEMAYWELIPAEQRQEVIRFYLDQRNKQQETSFLRLPIVTRSGRKVWIDQNARMFFKDNWVYKVSVVARDVTRSRAAEQRLAENEKILRSLVQDAPVGIFQTDAKGKCRFVNRRWSRITGLSEDQSIGDGWTKAFPQDVQSAVSELWEESTLYGKEFEMELPIDHPTWSTLWVEARATAIRSASGEINGFLGILIDITDLKNVQEKLEQAKEKAEEATNSKSLFLSMMSHEIRTPMNAIIGLSNILLEDEPRPDQTDSLELLKFSGQNLLSIINDILDFSKIEANKVVIEEIDFNLADACDKTVRMLELKAQEKGIALVYSFDEQLPDVVKGDPVRINQVITNLISNAVKFTERGTVSFHVGAGDTLSNGDIEYIFSVTDTGIGIPTDKLSTIFESFSQAASDTTRKFGGTGLGLTISRRLVNLMGGEIHVISQQGTGSTFSFILRLKPGTLTETTEKSDNKKALGEGAIELLLVEDNRINQIVATNFFKRWKVRYDVANNGREAVEMVQKKDYDLVFMDLQMPEMDGYEATRTIRKLEGERFQKLPIIALTASAMSSMKDNVLRAGMNDFMTKPFLPEALQEIIVRYVKTEKSQSFKKNEVLNANLDMYTQGNISFKCELIGHLLKNMEELKSALWKSLDEGDPVPFRIAAHKCKTSLTLLGDNELLNLVEKLNTDITEKGRPSEEDRHMFDQLMVTTIYGLNEELRELRPQS